MGFSWNYCNTDNNNNNKENNNNNWELGSLDFHTLPNNQSYFMF